MDQREIIAEASRRLQAAANALPEKPHTFVGLDGFIDEIVQVVDTREDFDTFQPVKTIADYAKRLAAAAGKSTNVELVLQTVKMGGNGPLMADAMGRLGSRVTYVGALGFPSKNPVFDSLDRHGETVSIADPGVTIAAEFDDGKIMHGKLASLAEITFDNIVTRAGGRPTVDRLLTGARLVALLNWTMIPHMTSVWRGMISRLLELGGAGPALFFFDLCDPQKRTRADICEAMEVIASFNRAKGTPILGLNEKESAEICAAVGVEYGSEDKSGMIARAQRLIEKTGIPEIVIHPRTNAVAVGPSGTGMIDGPVCANPRLTTGAGDHFNGGYCFARLLGLEPQYALAVGKATSGFYVREGRGPSPAEIARFCEKWVAGKLDPWMGP